jgi:hypothetical protein
MSSGPAERVFTLKSVAVLAKHTRITFQAHAMRIFDVGSANQASAPCALNVESQFFLSRFPAHLFSAPPYALL